MPSARDALLAAMAGDAKPKPRGSKRDARRGGVACTDACPPKPPGCLCVWGCWIHDGENAKPHHIRVGLDWDCPKHGKPGVPAGDWRNDKTIVRPEL